MSFTFSISTGCNANTNDATYNPTIQTPNNRIYKGHVNELRKAIEEWYTQHGAGTLTWTDTSGDSSLQSIKIRASHFNELRVAINKIRVNTRLCSCNGNCDCNGNCGCTCNTIYGCTCAGTCNCNLNTTWIAGLSSFSFNNESTDSSGAGTRHSTEDIVSDVTISEIKGIINYINTTTPINGKGVTGNNLSF